MQRRDFLKGVFGTVASAALPVLLKPQVMEGHNCYLLLSTTEDKWYNVESEKLVCDMASDKLADFGMDAGTTFVFDYKVNHANQI